MQKIDRRVRRTRRRLRNALIQLIVERGYDNITIQDITDAADLSRATFYLHYKDRDELLASSLEEMFDELVASIDNDTFIETWHSLNAPPSLLAFQHVAEYSDLYKSLLLGERGVTYVIYRAIHYLARVSHEQIMCLLPDDADPDIPVDIIAHHFAGSLFTTILWWLENDMPHPPDYMARVFHLIYAPGMMYIVGHAGEWQHLIHSETINPIQLAQQFNGISNGTTRQPNQTDDMPTDETSPSPD